MYYARLPSVLQHVRGATWSLHTLLTAGQVKRPMGLAVDTLRKVLYVADPGLFSVLAVPLFESRFAAGLVAADGPSKLLSEVTVHWVAVDSFGTLFCSDVEGGRVWSMPAAAIAARLRSREGSRPNQLYSAASADPLSSPQGLAVDGFHLFWANGQPGQGSIVRALEEPFGGGKAGDALQLADNVEEAFGVCLSSSRVFYTSRTAKVYSMRRGGSTPVLVSDGLQEPRGCAYDGDATIFVADAQAGAVYAFPAGSPGLTGVRPPIVLRVRGAYGLAAMPSGSCWPSRAGSSMMCLAVAAYALLHFSAQGAE